MIDFILKNKIYVGYIFELISAIAGIVYLRKSSKIKPGVKIFIYYLCFIVFAETFGLYALWAYFDNYETLPFLKDSPLHRNFWWYNIVFTTGYFAIGQLFIRQLTSENSKRLKTIHKTGMLLLLIYSIICFASFGEFLYAYDISVMILGTFFLLSCVGAYYFEILKTDKILVFNKSLVFYVSVGIVIWQLCVIPIQIYTSFFTEANPDFVNLYATVLRYANIYLYSIFTIGFVIDYRYNKSSSVSLETTL